MKVLHRLDNSNRGGIQETIFSLYKYSKHEHEFWAYDGSMAEEMRSAGMKLWHGGPPDDTHYDVVVGHGVGGWPHDGLADWAHKRGAKCIETMHSISRTPTSTGCLDGFIAMSNLALQQNPGFKNSAVIYGILDVKSFKPYNPDNRLIGRLGRLASEKDPQSVLLLARHFSGEQFVLAGDGDQMSDLIGRRTDNLQLVGWVRDFAEFYGRLRLFAFSSFDECCCMSVAMAQAAGVPVICRDMPPLRETTGGFACFQPDVPNIAGAIQRFLDSDSVKAEYYSRAAEGHAWAMEKFDKSVTIKAWDSYLDAL